MLSWTSPNFMILVASRCRTGDVLPCRGIALWCYSPSGQPSQEIKMPHQSKSLQKTTEQEGDACLWAPAHAQQILHFRHVSYLQELSVSEPQRTEFKHLNPALRSLQTADTAATTAAKSHVVCSGTSCEHFQNKAAARIPCHVVCNTDGTHTLSYFFHRWLFILHI